MEINLLEGIRNAPKNIVKDLNPFKRGSLGQDLIVEQLIRYSPLPQPVKDAVTFGIGVKQGGSLIRKIPGLGNPYVVSGLLIGGDIALRPGNVRNLEEDMALANQTLREKGLTQAQFPDYQMAPVEEDVTPAGPQRIPVETYDSESSRANDQTSPQTSVEDTKLDLYKRARERAMQTGRQEDYDTVRDLGLAMHAEFNPTIAKGNPLDLGEQTARARSFLAREIA